MQIDSDAASCAIAVFSSIVSSAVGYGIMRAKLDRVEKDIEHFEARFVSREVFAAIVDGIRTDLLSLRGDIKQLLELIKSNRGIS